VHGTLLTGAAMILQRGFDPEAVLSATSEATMFFGVPTMYARLTSASDAGRLRVLRLCISGSAPLAAEIHRRIEELSGQRVLERYGMTETVMNLSNPHDGERRPGTVGFELPGVEVRLGDETGEILLRGPNVFHGYWRRPEATAESFTDDGWFRSGDLAERDTDGYYRIVGRSKELIISGGFNVYPREIEDVLLGLPGVREVAVVGTPSLEWGEIVTACIVAEAGPIDDGVIAEFCSTRLVAYKRPRLVRFVDALPRNAMGKIVRSELVE
jgi:malonyl-CoA/methylmalonyl-CoA synthetase